MNSKKRNLLPYLPIIPERYHLLVYYGLVVAGLLLLWQLNTTLGIVLTMLVCSFLCIEGVIWCIGRHEQYIKDRHRSTSTRRLTSPQYALYRALYSVRLARAKSSWSQKISSLQSELVRLRESQDALSLEQQLVRQTLDSLTPSSRSSCGSTQMKQGESVPSRSSGVWRLSEDRFKPYPLTKTQKNTHTDSYRRC